jgi:Lrp/AsnC family transcriptional regulator for asnA, asnC and gidA
MNRPRASPSRAPARNGGRVGRDPGRGEVVPLDDVDRSIIQQLQVDGRRTYTRLAAETGLSEAAVRQRVQRLLDAGVMSVVAITDPLTVGMQRMAMIGLKVEGDLRAVAKQLADIPQIDYVVIASGAYDIIVEVTCADDHDLLEILNDNIRSLPGVRSTDTFVLLQMVKQTYTWGVRK